MKKITRTLSVLLICALLVSLLALPGLAAESYVDVPAEAWYADAVAELTASGLMNGTGDGAFSPNKGMTRAMFLTVLHRLADCPEAEPAGFADVPADTWYTAAANWAAKAGLVPAAGNFDPNTAISRLEMAEYAYAFAQALGRDVSPAADLSVFTDCADLSSAAMSWAVAVHLFQGNDRGELQPAKDARRCEVAAVLVRLTAWEGQCPVALSADGATVTYGFAGEEKTLTLDAKNLYVDARLTAEEAAKSPYVFTSLIEALEHLEDGTEAAPMNLWLAPSVYWIHDPASPSTDKLYEVTVECQNLHITGLTDDPKNVVVAGNYGHDKGYDGGNPTMFLVKGDGLTLKNLTFGNYCCNDLVYNLDVTQNTPKRDQSSNITQGQIGFLEGDKLFAENVRFESRLNLNPFISPNEASDQRALYVDCFFACTDDSLNNSANAVYLNCTFDLYSSKPFWHANGAKLLNSTVNLLHGGTQYLSKEAGPFTLLDVAFVSDFADSTLLWSEVLPDTYRSYTSGLTLNGEPVEVSAGKDYSVDFTAAPLMKAYTFTDAAGETVYNVYNLLHGADGWDPLNQKAAAEAAGAADLPTKLTATLEGNATELVSGTAPLTATAEIAGSAKLTWSVPAEQASAVTLAPAADGLTCTVEGINDADSPADVRITVKDESGLEAVLALKVWPSILPAPTFTADPALTVTEGVATLSYTLDLGERADLSRVIWSLCDDAEGTNAVVIAASNTEEPLMSVPLVPAYVGKTLKVTVEPKHIRSEYGEAVTVYSAPITAENAPAVKALKVNLDAFPVATQTVVAPGLWSVDTYKPLDVQEGEAFFGGWTGDATVAPDSLWLYGTGDKSGYKDYTGIYFSGRGARLRYTPSEAEYGDMSFTAKLAPGKTAAQGFGSTNQYMEFMVKYDTANHVGYGLRIYRISSGSCGFVLVSHNADGTATLLGEVADSKAFNTECTVRVWTEGTALHAHVETTKSDDTVDLTAEIPASTFGGVCVQHTGTGGGNTVYIGALEIAW